MSRNYNIDITDQLEVTAVVLPPKTLECGQGMIPSRDGEWRLFTKLYRTQARPLQIGILCFAGNFEWCSQFKSFLIKNALELGIALADPQIYEVRDPGEYFERLNQFVVVGSVQPGNQVDIVIPVLDQGVEYYDIKREANRLGIATQCVMLDRRRLKDGVIKNIFYSINSKIGGVNVRVREIDEAYKKLNAGVADPEGNRWVVMSLDVYHGDTRDSDKPSIVALITSLNSDCTHTHTEMMKQKGNQEIVYDIDIMIVKSLEQYRKMNGALPSRILFYRDGVGEGMYDLVTVHEIPKIELALQQLYQGQRAPLLTHLVVQKRNHLKCTTNGQTNPPPGSVIDTVIVDSDDDNNNNNVQPNNFYLYSHKALAGTARPVHYQVIRDDNKIGIRSLEDFTYILAYLHGGCTRSISIPYPLFLADAACGQVGAAGFDDIHPNLANTPFSI
eukprot:TRINITY_DN6469_c0_g1_i1.p1 TRINITY_DN6469_c0_g1~~TRINITY_DN6469_c0_g1_i1.p1  ORF type:complete len:494 (-),score=68.98 TRINITY_DN6469_c0_g1_i1:257-1591(-)